LQREHVRPPRLPVAGCARRVDLQTQILIASPSRLPRPEGDVKRPMMNGI
jgi:hypothetical protein